MQKNYMIEVWVGVFALLAMATLIFMAFKVSNLTTSGTQGETYEISARFSNVGGLKPRSPVKMAGVKIGEVKQIYYDKELYEAVVVLTIDKQFDTLPEDTSASILTSGLLGDQYVGLDPGGLPFYLADGDELTLTQSAIIIEKVIGEFLFRQAKGEENE
jgi:phospholipid/cholesterol/gamma-HCH transport system substrate-binding protein